MKVLVQRVTDAAVEVDDQTIGQIGKGYLLFLGVMEGDTQEQADWLAQKVVNLRLFDGEDGKINDQSLLDIGGQLLVVSQFTLSADVKKGNRPDYTGAAKPAEAKELYEYFIEQLRNQGTPKVETGEFGAMMAVSLTNDGPVTLLLER